MSIKYRVEAYLSLLRRYRDIFQYHWKNRKEVSTDLFKEHEAEFLPPALALQEKPVSPASRLTAKVLMVLVGILLLWSIFGRIDITVNALGKIISSGRTKTIASVDVASVKAIHVQEGQKVKAGDVLIELDATAFDAERDKATSGQMMALLQMARSRALIAAVDNMKPPRL